MLDQFHDEAMLRPCPQSLSTAMSPSSTFGGAEVKHATDIDHMLLLILHKQLTVYVFKTCCQGVSERVEEHLVEMLEQEKDELDAQLHVCKRQRLDELSKRVAVKVMEEIKVAVMEHLVEDTMYSQTFP